MPEQVSLPLETAVAAPPPPVHRFVLPDEPKTDAPAPAASEPNAQNTGEQATPAASDGDPPKVEEVTPEQAAKREGRRFERKLDKAYRQRAEALAKAELLERQLNEVRKPAAPQPVPGEPTIEQFDYDPEKYATAKAEFAKTQALKELEAQKQSESAKQAQHRLVSGWEEQVAKAESKYDDFDEVVGEIKPTAPWSIALMESEQGSDVAYYLGKNLEEAKRIAALSPVAQIRAIGRLEAKLAADPVKPITPSKAPEPIAPLSGTGAVTPRNEPSEEDDMATWIKKRNKQIRGR